jgi:hypothetical protein
MDDDVERLNRLLDDLAAERDPRERAQLSATEVELAQTAAFLKAAHGERSTPTEECVERLGRQLVAASSTEEQSQRAGSAPAPGLSRRGLLGRMIAGAAGLVVGAGAGTAVGTRVSAAEAYERGKDDGYQQEVREPFEAPLVPADRSQWLDTGHSAGGVRLGQAVRFRVGAIVGLLVSDEPGQWRRHLRPLRGLHAHGLPDRMTGQRGGLRRQPRSPPVHARRSCHRLTEQRR